MIGTTIAGKYKILKPLGAGGMGVVYEAVHTGTGRHVALKLLQEKRKADDQVWGRFAREARAVGAIESPHIVQVLDSGIAPESGLPYLAMELLRGRDLGVLVKERATLPTALALRIVGQACAALVKAHEAGVIHRDIKLGNLFLADTDAGVTVKLLDFGIAKLTTVDALDPGDGSDLTRTGVFVGSPRYMSPEQARARKDVDHRSDLYSLGVVLFKLVTGSTPFRDVESLGDLVIAQMTRGTPQARSLAPWVDEKTEAILNSALKSDRDLRYPSASEMLADIKKIVGGDLSLTTAMITEELHAHASVAPPADPSHGGQPTTPLRGGRAAMASETPGPAPADHTEAMPNRPRGPIWPFVAAAAVLAIAGVGLGAYAMKRAHAPVASAATTPAVSEAPSASTTPVPASDSPPMIRSHKVKLIVPADAGSPLPFEVYVDGDRSLIVQMGIYVEGPIGSTHQVRVVGKDRTIETTVTVNKWNVIPDSIDLTTPAASVAQQGKPTRGIGAKPATAATTTTKPAPSASFNLQKSFE